MNSAIILIKDKDLAAFKLLDKNLLTYIIKQFDYNDFAKIYILGADETLKFKTKGRAIFASSLKEVLNELEDDSRILLCGISYPKLPKKILLELLDKPLTYALKFNDDDIETFIINKDDCYNLHNLKYETLEFKDIISDNLKDYKAIYDYNHKLQKAINLKLVDEGINIIDIDNTYIGDDVVIKKGTIIYPNVIIEGNSIIGENCTITSGSHLINAKVGNNCNIIQSRIVDSILHNNIDLGPSSHIRGSSEIYDNARIGNYVEFKNTIFKKGSKCAHLTYLGDAEIGENVNIGCGVVTVNYDGAHKYKTIVGDRAFIGSNVNLIAPIKVGNKAVVAAGSTVNKDVVDGAMAIARSYQTVKLGYGDKYIDKEK